MNDLLRKLGELEGLLRYAAAHGGLDNQEWVLRVLQEAMEAAKCLQWTERKAA